jgi:hypothetical protein
MGTTKVTPRQGSWLRRIVPNGYATATLRLTGTSPLLMNSAEADRDSELFRAYTLLGQKKAKTLDDEARLRALEWELRVYLDADLGPYVPGRNVKRMLVEAAGKFRKGATVERSLIAIDYRIPLEYDGPRDQDGLWDGGYRYTTMVKNAGFNAGRVMRCRPMFPVWSLTAELAFDPEEVDADTLGLIVERSQRYGLGDYRPEFGAFSAILDLTPTKRASRNGLGNKARNGHDEAAHDAFKARIMDPEDLVPA